MSNNKTALFGALLICLITNCFSRQPAAEARIQSEQKPGLDTFLLQDKTNDRARITLIDDFLNAAGITGGVLVAKNGEVILRKGYGWADENRKIPMTTKSVCSRKLNSSYITICFKQARRLILT